MPAWKVLSTLRRRIIFEFENCNGCILSQDTSIFLGNEECCLVGEQCRTVVRSLGARVRLPGPNHPLHVQSRAQVLTLAFSSVKWNHKSLPRDCSED